MTALYAIQARVHASFYIQHSLKGVRNALALAQRY